MSRLRVLLVEDHPINRQVVEVMLEPIDAQISFAHDGRQAVRACHETQFDLVLLDLQLPIMDGLTALALIRRQEAEVGRTPAAIAVVTGHVSEGRRAEAKAWGADSFVAKPVTLRALFSGVLEALQARRARLG